MTFERFVTCSLCGFCKIKILYNILNEPSFKLNTQTLIGVLKCNACITVWIICAFIIAVSIFIEKLHTHQFTLKACNCSVCTVNVYVVFYFSPRKFTVIWERTESTITSKLFWRKRCGRSSSKWLRGHCWSNVIKLKSSRYIHIFTIGLEQLLLYKVFVWDYCFVFGFDSCLFRN